MTSTCVSPPCKSPDRRVGHRSPEWALLPRRCITDFTDEGSSRVRGFQCLEVQQERSYSAKSEYWLGFSSAKSLVRIEAEAFPSLNPLKEKCWFLKIPLKLKVFLWKCLSNALHVAEDIAKRGMKVDERCQLCGEEPDTANHILFSCHLARRVWDEVNVPLQCGGFYLESIFQNINHLLKLGDGRRVEDENYKAFPWILWRIWENIKDFIFEGKIYKPSIWWPKCLMIGEIGLGLKWWQTHVQILITYQTQRNGRCGNLRLRGG